MLNDHFFKAFVVFAVLDAEAGFHHHENDSVRYQTLDKCGSLILVLQNAIET